MPYREGEIVERIERPVPRHMQSRGYRAGEARRKKKRKGTKGAIREIQARHKRAMDM